MTQALSTSTTSTTVLIEEGATSSTSDAAGMNARFDAAYAQVGYPGARATNRELYDRIARDDAGKTLFFAIVELLKAVIRRRIHYRLYRGMRDATQLRVGLESLVMEYVSKPHLAVAFLELGIPIRYDSPHYFSASYNCDKLERELAKEVHAKANGLLLDVSGRESARLGLTVRNEGRAWPYLARLEASDLPATLAANEAA